MNTGYLRTFYFYFLLYKNTKMQIQLADFFCLLFSFALPTDSSSQAPPCRTI